MSGADLVAQHLTDPQSGEGAERVTAHSEMSLPLHNACVHFLYRGAAALLPPSALARFEVYKRGAMFKMIELGEGRVTRTWGH